MDIYCHETKAKCCSSCHNEWDDGYGYPMEWTSPTGRTMLSSCCGRGKDVYDLDSRKDWARMICDVRKYRRSETGSHPVLHEKGTNK